VDATLKAFRDAVIVRNVAARHVKATEDGTVAMEFPTEEARKNYLQQHPKADPSKHTVRDPSAPKKPSKKEQAAAGEAAHQKSEAYSKGKKKDYYPQKMPEGMEMPKEVKALPKQIQQWVDSMPDEDLDKDQGYKHKAVKEVAKQVLQDLKNGDEKTVQEEFQRLYQLKSETFDKYMNAKTDAEADPYRFATRKLTQVWRAYSNAISDFNYSKGPKPAPKPKAPAAPKAPAEIDDTDIDDQDNHYKSEAYKTKRNRGYSPSKAPSNLKEPEDIKKLKSRLNKDQLSWMESMPDEDLDKNEADEHPKIKAVIDSLSKKMESGEMTTQDVTHEMRKLQDMRSTVNDKYMDAKTDQEADEYRFPMRALYKVWQGYNWALQRHSRPKQAAELEAFKDAMVAHRVAKRVLSHRG